MKKSILGVLGAAALLGGSFAPSGTFAPTNQTTVQKDAGGQQAQQNTPQPAQTQATQQQVQIKDRFRPMSYNFRDPGTSPKEWGQYLQRTGRQKWTKRRSVI